MTESSSAATTPGRTRMKIDCMLAYELGGTCEFVFLIHAALGISPQSGPVVEAALAVTRPGDDAPPVGQTLIEETLLIEPRLPFRTYSDPRSGNRFLRLQAPAGPLTVSYRALVDRVITPPDLQAAEVPVHDIPDNVLRFLMPTRYCESDHLGPAALKLFGALPGGYARVMAISDWVRNNIDYRIGSTNATTTARDVFVQRSGVCRDFAHLAVTFCRALNIPARLVSGYASFPEPPPDFHAIFEAYLGGRWVRFDPTGMVPVDQVVRVATGRDAKDVAFATIFGPARMVAISPEVALVTDPEAAPAPVKPAPVQRQTSVAV